MKVETPILTKLLSGYDRGYSYFNYGMPWLCCEKSVRSHLVRLPKRISFVVSDEPIRDGIVVLWDYHNLKSQEPISDYLWKGLYADARNWLQTHFPLKIGHKKILYITAWEHTK